MLTIGAILTAASLIMHGISYLWGSNSTVKTITNVVDTGTSLAGGTVAATPRGTQDATPKVTTTTRPDGTVVHDHRG